jgi:hypothetical protein
LEERNSSPEERVAGAVMNIFKLSVMAKIVRLLGIISQILDTRYRTYKKTQGKKTLAAAELKKFLEDPKWSFMTLSAGDVVGFTHLDKKAEETLTRQCWGQDIAVTKSITDSLDLLVIDDRRFSKSAKLRDSLQEGNHVTLLSHFIESNPEIAKSLKAQRSKGWRSFLS